MVFTIYTSNHHKYFISLTEVSLIATARYHSSVERVRMGEEGRDGFLIDFTVNWNLISRNIFNISANNDWTRLIRSKWNDISPQTERYLLGFQFIPSIRTFIFRDNAMPHSSVNLKAFELKNNFSIWSSLRPDFLRLSEWRNNCFDAFAINFLSSNQLQFVSFH